MKNYKDQDTVFILTEFEEIEQELDNVFADLSMILGNRYVTTIRAEAEKEFKHLKTIAISVELWKAVQRKWTYLDNIFKAPDIKRNLQKHSNIFE